MASNFTPNASGPGTPATTSDSKVKIDLVTMPAQEFLDALAKARADGWQAAMESLKPAVREVSATVERMRENAKMMVEFNEAMRKK
jgi:hypothetical protein